ncbi:hypothetical protein F4808DRAFT_315485 [Astrocystis sublimbata]|nr:hypothetical protein F4808DRAFT_315485 [Astrocystis sublimbata]
MSPKLYPAIPADAGRIAEIHMAAFASNAMLLAQFPTPEVREGLQESIRLKALADIEDSRITVLVVRDVAQDSDPSAQSVIAFAKWSHPVGKDEQYEETPWVWPPGTDMHILESWGRAAEEAQEELVGDQPCYLLVLPSWAPIHCMREEALLL